LVAAQPDERQAVLNMNITLTHDTTCHCCVLLITITKICRQGNVFYLS